MSIPAVGTRILSEANECAIAGTGVLYIARILLVALPLSSVAIELLAKDSKFALQLLVTLL